MKPNHVISRGALILSAAAAVAIGCKSSTEPSTTAPATTVSFAEVQPLLNEKCVKCHGENGKGGIDLHTYDAVMKGGDEGPIVKAGDAEGSVLVQVLRGTHGKKQMPFKQPPLSEDDIKKLEDWIKAGAKA